MWSFPVRRTRRGRSQIPTAAAAPRNTTILRKTIRISITLPPPERNATAVDNSKMTRMSSNTAAPSNPNPTLLRSTLSSISTCAEIETDVAPRVRPRNSAWAKDMPRSSPNRMPEPTGTTTPRIPENSAAREFLVRSLMFNSRPARNISSSTPISPSS